MKRFIPLLLLMLTLCSCSSGFSAPKIKEIEPYTEQTENAYRFYDTYVDAFIPSDDYGKVYPYIGEVLSFEHGPSHVLYGFCSEDGGIICDAVYEYPTAVSTDEYSYYIVRPFGETPSKIVVIRDDGRAARTLDDFALSFINNHGYLQYSILQDDKFVYKYLDPDLTPADVDLKPVFQQSRLDKPPEYADTCPCCNEVFFSDGTHATVHGYNSSYAYYHLNSETGMLDIFTPAKTVQLSIPLDGQPYALSLTPDVVFGHRRQGASFLYDRQSQTFIPLPAEQVGISTMSTDFLKITHNGEDGNTHYLYDVSAKALRECELSRYINGCLITMHNGISRVTRDGQDVFTLRLLVD